MYSKENPNKDRGAKRRKMDVPSYVFITEGSNSKIKSSTEIKGKFHHFKVIFYLKFQMQKLNLKQ